MYDHGYGYAGALDSIRKNYSNLPTAYLDNAASTLVMDSIPFKAAEALLSIQPRNPHSKGTKALETIKIINETRKKILNLFNADESKFEVIFCANATAAAKLVGECIHKSHYIYLADSHTSLVGLRQLAETSEVFTEETYANSEFKPGSVVTWPLQSNFHGKRYPGKAWCEKAHQNNCLALIDIASYVTTEIPDLNDINPDFAILSFYKMFGYPDLGALIVRRTEAVEKFLLNKRYFGGGTVEFYTPSARHMERPEARLSDWLEDGTVPFHSVITLNIALSEFEKVYGVDFGTRIGAHVNAVASYCRKLLSRIQYCHVIDIGNDSPIVTFQLETIGHNEFVEAASLSDIHLRSGTLCNVGAYLQHSRATEDFLVYNHYHRGKKCNDDISFIDGISTGFVRASFGPYSSYQEADALVSLVSQLTTRSSQALPLNTEEEHVAKIKSLFVYPIKSCYGMRVATSLLTPAGLLYDRAFCLVELSTMKVMSLKKFKSLIFVKPSVKGDHLIVESSSPTNTFHPIAVPLESAQWSQSLQHDQMLLNMDSAVIAWFSKAAGVACTLAKNHDTSPGDVSQLKDRVESSFANSSPLLITNIASAKSLNISDIEVFRPNIVIDASLPWIEDNHATFQLSDSVLIENLGKCRRCNMICITKEGKSDNFPYMQLCRYRKFEGKIYFGQHARPGKMSVDATLSEGDYLLMR